jgi:hypothetical protein
MKIGNNQQAAGSSTKPSQGSARCGLDWTSFEIRPSQSFEQVFTALK